MDIEARLLQFGDTHTIIILIFYLMMAWILVLYFLLKTHQNRNKNWVNDDDQKLEGGLGLIFCYAHMLFNHEMFWC